MSALSITILICAAGMAPQDCTSENAIAVLKPAPTLYETFHGIGPCGKFAQEFAASLHYLEPGEDGRPVAYVKPRCSFGAPSRSVG